MLVKNKMKGLKFEVAVLKAVMASSRKKLATMKPGPNKNAQLKKLAHAQKLLSMIPKRALR
jgi:hypothetical protein